MKHKLRTRSEQLFAAEAHLRASALAYSNARNTDKATELRRAALDYASLANDIDSPKAAP